MLFRFHGSLEYGSMGCVSRVGIALPDREKKSIQYFVSQTEQKVITFRVWWNARQHRTRFPPFRAVIVRGAKTRALRHTP
jgi:hypothetical protein